MFPAPASASSYHTFFPTLLPPQMSSPLCQAFDHSHPHSLSKLPAWHYSVTLLTKGSQCLNRTASAQPESRGVVRVRCTEVGQALAQIFQTHHLRHKSHLWEYFPKQITPKRRKPPLANRWMIMLNVMGLLYFTLMQNQRFHYSTETNISKGHEKVVWDMQDVMYKLEGRLSPL